MRQLGRTLPMSVQITKKRTSGLFKYLTLSMSPLASFSLGLSLFSVPHACPSDKRQFFFPPVSLYAHHTLSLDGFYVLNERFSLLTSLGSFCPCIV